MNTPKHRPLLSGRLALVGSALLLVLLPLARARREQAAVEAPSSLSLRYLALHVAKHPEDRDKLAQSGQRPEARAALLPLTAAGLDDAVQRRLIELDRQAWRAIAPVERVARACALDRLLRDLRALDAQRMPPRELRRFAALHRALDQPLTAAERQSRVYDREPTLNNLEAADSAWLALGMPARAGEPQAGRSGARTRAAAGEEPSRREAPAGAGTSCSEARSRARAARDRVRYRGDLLHATRTRHLGAGLTFDAGLGTSFRLPAAVGVAGFRFVGRAAPRFARSPAELSGNASSEIWQPQSSEGQASVRRSARAGSTRHR